MHSKTFILCSDKCSLRCKLAEGVLLSLVRAELGKVCSPKSRAVESIARAMRKKKKRVRFQGTSSYSVIFKKEERKEIKNISLMKIACYNGKVLQWAIMAKQNGNG